MDYSKVVESYSCADPFAHLNFPSTSYPQVFAAISGDPKAKWSDSDFPLKVSFLNKDALGKEFKWIYRGEPITVKKLIKWSNEWCSKSNVFKKVNSEHADIRVKFCGDLPSESKIGAYAKSVDPTKPTMLLNLSAQPGDENKKHTVIHEFGHSLGLLHEHERPDLWDMIGPFLNMKKIEKYHDKSMIGDPCKYFGPLTDYDSRSIMHYPWLEMGFLKEGYRTVKDINARRAEMTEEQYKVLIDVVTGPRRITAPSVKDKEGLRKAYNLPHAVELMEVAFYLESGVLVLDHGGSPDDLTYSDVYVCGSFNDWKERIQMLPNALGKLTATVNLPVGKHQYKFLVDGEWCYHSDMPTVYNDHGTYNNEVNVTQKHIDAHNDDQNLTDHECPPKSVIWF